MDEKETQIRKDGVSADGRFGTHEVTDAQETAETQDTGAPPRPKRPIERFYDKFEGVPLKALDIFIGILIAVFIILVVLGYLKGHEMI